MNATAIAVGTHVRYPRTGTTGTVVKFEEIDGRVFAELDTTHLFYRVDDLIAFDRREREKGSRGEDFREILKKEKEFLDQIDESWRHIDESCEGGG